MYGAVTWVLDRIVGKLLVRHYKMAKSHGDHHSARHSLAALVYGNSGWCSEGDCLGMDEGDLLREVEAGVEKLRKIEEKK